jgi:hypothetical protein
VQRAGEHGGAHDAIAVGKKEGLRSKLTAGSRTKQRSAAAGSGTCAGRHTTPGQAAAGSDQASASLV